MTKLNVCKACHKMVIWKKWSYPKLFLFVMLHPKELQQLSHQLGFEFEAQQFRNCLRKQKKGSIPFPGMALTPSDLLIKVFQVFLSFKLKSPPGKPICFGSSAQAASPEFSPQLPSPLGVPGVPRRDKYIPHQKRICCN